jgi:hypothetical protein
MNRQTRNCQAADHAEAVETFSDHDDRNRSLGFSTIHLSARAPGATHRNSQAEELWTAADQ